MSRRESEPESTLQLDGAFLRSDSRWYGSWSIEVDRIRLLGEATDEMGPFADDWYLVVAVDGTGWSEASMYSPGVSEVLEELGRQLGSQVAPLGLAASTTFNSRVLWPPSLHGKAVFTYEQDAPRNLIERALWPVMKPPRNVQRFTTEVAAYLEGTGV